MRSAKNQNKSSLRVAEQRIGQQSKAESQNELFAENGEALLAEAVLPGSNQVSNPIQTPSGTVEAQRSTAADTNLIDSAEQGTVVQRWGLSDLVPDGLKRAGRSIAKAAGKALGSVTNLAKAGLGTVAKLANRIPGYSLLTNILGKDPISDQGDRAMP